jgi:apolipoprotein N-acyltransferase
MIDPYGRILAEIDLGEKGAIDSEQPKAVSSTLFVRLGILIEISMMGLAFACWLVLRVQPIGSSH